MDDIQQELLTAERQVQSKKKEYLDSQQNYQILQDELDVLKVESVSGATSLQKMKTQKVVLKGELDQKVKQLETFRNRHDEIESNLEKREKGYYVTGETGTDY